MVYIDILYLYAFRYICILELIIRSMDVFINNHFLVLFRSFNSLTQLYIVFIYR